MQLSIQHEFTQEKKTKEPKNRKEKEFRSI